jgi:2-oxoacid:acceptor oxidoreductase gamma subunit (pyruvate/2-ketoisovalerate family)
VFNGCNKNTKVIINTPKSAAELNLSLPLKNIFTVNASGIALEIIGKNIMNTVVLGAFAKATGLISLDGLRTAIKEKFAEKGEEIINKNIKAIERAYEIN